MKQASFYVKLEHINNFRKMPANSHPFLLSSTFPEILSVSGIKSLLKNRSVFVDIILFSVVELGEMVDN